MDNRVKECREAIGWTQAQLAEAAGVSRPVISKIEQNKPNAEVKTSTLSKIAMALNKPISAIFFN